MNKLRIGIAGCGAIGSSLAKKILRDFSKEARLTGLYDTDTNKSKQLAGSILKNRLVTSSLAQLVARSQLVIEATSAASAFGIARYTLAKKRDIMIMSIGGVAGHFRQLMQLAKKNNTKVYLPSGAISGIDALKALNLSKIKQVTLTTRKNPASFKGVRYIEEKGIKLDKIKKDTLLFLGSAEKAVHFFPQNINVAGLLSIAGVGAKNTLVKIIASPGLRKNIHEIQVQSEAANVFTRSENIAHPQNPKTSYLAFLSAAATLKQILGPVKIGT
ncbi:MAG: aspartate dehydrogenase [Candidatus Omnitrophica bacterium]|nr:aspartate dehydrogenase [Candidatus Omnitrophota bacterium]MDD5237933.1 aspartate dehydrogenase [Candidatus Omnitrophota bacterium]